MMNFLYVYTDLQSGTLFTLCHKLTQSYKLQLQYCYESERRHHPNLYLQFTDDIRGEVVLIGKNKKEKNWTSRAYFSASSIVKSIRLSIDYLGLNWTDLIWFASVYSIRGKFRKFRIIWKYPSSNIFTFTNIFSDKFGFVLFGCFFGEGWLVKGELGLEIGLAGMASVIEMLH